jgi:hypothetical protein
MMGLGSIGILRRLGDWMITYQATTPQASMGQKQSARNSVNFRKIIGERRGSGRRYLATTGWSF